MIAVTGGRTGIRIGTRFARCASLQADNLGLEVLSLLLLFLDSFHDIGVEGKGYGPLLFQLPGEN